MMYIKYLLTEKVFENFYLIVMEFKDPTFYHQVPQKIKKLGFKTYINIDTLKDGKHLLKISRKYINKKKDTVRNIPVSIPFWKFNTDK